MEQLYTQYLILKSAHIQQRTLYIEPWAEEMAILPGGVYQVVAQGPVDYCLEIEFGENIITVYGWPGSTLSIFEGERVLRECLTPAPPLPRVHPKKHI